MTGAFCFVEVLEPALVRGENVPGPTARLTCDQISNRQAFSHEGAFHFFSFLRGPVPDTPRNVFFVFSRKPSNI